MLTPALMDSADSTSLRSEGGACQLLGRVAVVRANAEERDLVLACDSDEADAVLQTGATVAGDVARPLQVEAEDVGKMLGLLPGLCVPREAGVCGRDGRGRGRS